MDGMKVVSMHLNIGDAALKYRPALSFSSVHLLYSFRLIVLGATKDEMVNSLS